jgi:iron complex transport system ATP-binding protein
VSAAIVIRDLEVSFNGSAVVRGIDIDVAPGEWVGLIGPNGAGKTTVLRTVVGAVDYRGDVRILGDETPQLEPRELARRVALVPQQPVLPSGMRVLDYVLLGRTPHIGALHTETQPDLEIVVGVVESLDLLPLAGRDIATLSGGELQRAVIARALAQESPILLLDEPTSSLDIGRQQEIMELVEGLRLDRRLTVLSALHDLTIAGQFTDRLLLMAGGRIEANGHPRDVLTPGTIETHFGARVRIAGDESGGVIVIPMRSGAPASKPTDEAVSAADRDVEQAADEKSQDPAEQPDGEVLRP